MISPDAIWAILVKECAAPDHLRKDFLVRVADTAAARGRDTFEFRFCGALGFGGKLYQVGSKLYVSAYPEDLNQERRASILKANIALAALTP